MLELTQVNLLTGQLTGSAISSIQRTIADLQGVFADEVARQALPQSQVAYRVQLYQPVAEGTEGGLFWGNTFIEPGQVGDEYFMTKGHFHAQLNRGEYYVGVAGEGALILMSENRHTWLEEMRPGSVHYIPGHTAHRVANTGTTTLSFLACWPADAGHDYQSIAEHGFGARLRQVNGRAELIAESTTRSS